MIFVETIRSVWMFLLSLTGETTNSDITIGLLILVICLCLLALVFFIIIKSTKRFRNYRRTKRFVKRQEKKHLKSLRLQYGVSHIITLLCLSGLPIPNRTNCFLMISPRGFLFEYYGTTFELPYEKVCEVYVSGRMIPRHMTTLMSYEFIITYLDNNFVQKIRLGCPYPQKVEPFINAFRSQPLRASQNPQNFQL